jgi:hypothetical protein
MARFVRDSATTTLFTPVFAMGVSVALPMNQAAGLSPSMASERSFTDRATSVPFADPSSSGALCALGSFR